MEIKSNRSPQKTGGTPLFIPSFMPEMKKMEALCLDLQKLIPISFFIFVINSWNHQKREKKTLTQPDPISIFHISILKVS